MKRLFWLLPVVLTMLMTGCLKEDDMNQTIVLLGTESEVKPIDEMGMDTLLKFIDVKPELSLYRGVLPPDIQGEFVFVPEQVIVNDPTNSQSLDTIRFRFGGEAHPVLLIDTTGTVVDTSWYYPEGQNNMMVSCDIDKDTLVHVSDAFVIGNGDAFTAYFTVTYGLAPSGTVIGKLERGYVITGKVTKTGIDNAVVAFVNRYEGDFDGSEEIDIFAYKGKAVRKEWFNH